jgi:hypothetical protein
VSADEVETGIGPVLAFELTRVRCVSICFSLSMFFWGGDVPPDEPNEACPFPSVDFFFKPFPTISQSDASQRVNVRFFLPTSPNGAPKREREQGNHGEAACEVCLSLGSLRVVGSAGNVSPPLPSSFPYRPTAPPYTLHPTPYTTHCTLHYTLHTAHYTLHYTLHPTPCTLHYTLPSTVAGGLPNTPPGGGPRTSGGVG